MGKRDAEDSWRTEEGAIITFRMEARLPGTPYFLDPRIRMETICTPKFFMRFIIPKYFESRLNTDFPDGGIYLVTIEGNTVSTDDL